jgi:4-amino-4-deoxychorismate lyase
LYIESIKIEDGVVYNIDYHQHRYESVLGLTDRTPLYLNEYINPPKKKGLWRCRILYTLEEIESVEYFSYKKRDINSLKLIDADSIEYSKKYANRVELENLFVQKGACDDILIVKNGFITDISIANIALLKDGIWYTPKEPLLRGTTRQRLLEIQQIIPKDIKVDEIYSYERVALLNAMIDFDIIPQKNIRKIIC